MSNEKQSNPLFRPMRRNKRQLSNEVCINILKNAKRGVLAVSGDNDYPYALFVNYVYDEKDNAIYIHGAKEGHKIDSIKRCNKVSFTVHDEGYKKEGDWAYTLTSVVIFGKAELINDINITTEKTRNLANRYYPSKDEVEKEIKSGITHVQLIKINIEHMSGKTIHEK